MDALSVRQRELSGVFVALRLTQVESLTANVSGSVPAPFETTPFMLIGGRLRHLSVSTNG